MAITSLEIIYQPILIGGTWFRIVSIGNEINHIVRAFYLDEPPASIGVTVSMNTSGTGSGIFNDTTTYLPLKYKAGYDAAEGKNYVDFLFFTSEIVRPQMGAIDDHHKIDEQAELFFYPKNLSLIFRYFDISNTDKFVKVYQRYKQGVKQISQGLINYVEDVTFIKNYVAPKNFYCYVYFMPTNSSDEMLHIEGVPTTLIAKGNNQLRGVVKTLQYNDLTVKRLALNPGTLKKDITLVDFNYKCDLLVKYLDEDGEYLFWVFNEFFEIVDSSKEIGKVDVFNYTSEFADTNQTSLGQTTKRTYNASTTVSEELITTFSSIYTSPRIYLLRYNGETMANDSDFDACGSWLQVTAKTEGIRKKRKGGNLNANITFTLPEISNITML